MGVAVCPMCHCANRESAKRCEDCDYEFGQDADTVRALLRTQLTNAKAMFGVLLVADAALLGALVFTVMHGYVMLPVLPFLFFTWQAARAARTISITKHSMRLIDKQRPQLPKATLHSG